MSRDFNTTSYNFVYIWHKICYGKIGNNLANTDHKSLHIKHLRQIFGSTHIITPYQYYT